MITSKVLIKVKERNQELANRWADQLSLICPTIPELQASYFISNDEATEFGCIQVWDSREPFESNYSKFRNKSAELITDEQFAGISVEVYEVIKSL